MTTGALLVTSVAQPSRFALALDTITFTVAGALVGAGIDLAVITLPTGEALTLVVETLTVAAVLLATFLAAVNRAISRVALTNSVVPLGDAHTVTSAVAAGFTDACRTVLFLEPFQTLTTIGGTLTVVGTVARTELLLTALTRPFFVALAFAGLETDTMVGAVAGALDRLSTVGVHPTGVTFAAQFGLHIFQTERFEGVLGLRNQQRILKLAKTMVGTLFGTDGRDTSGAVVTHITDATAIDALTVATAVFVTLLVSAGRTGVVTFAEAGGLHHGKMGVEREMTSLLGEITTSDALTMALTAAVADSAREAGPTLVTNTTLEIGRRLAVGEHRGKPSGGNLVMLTSQNTDSVIGTAVGTFLDLTVLTLVHWITHALAVDTGTMTVTVVETSHGFTVHTGIGRGTVASRTALVIMDTFAMTTAISGDAPHLLTALTTPSFLTIARTQSGVAGTAAAAGVIRRTMLQPAVISVPAVLTHTLGIVADTMLEERETVMGTRVTRLSGAIETATTFIACASTIHITFSSSGAVVQAALAVAIVAGPSRFARTLTLTVAETVETTSMLKVGITMVIVVEDTVRGFGALGFGAVGTPESRGTLTLTFHTRTEFLGLTAVVGAVLELALVPVPA